MLDEQTNEELTQVGPGSPCGELLRRYWHPFAPASELSAEHPTRRVRLLGEDLVAFRGSDGRYGLVGEHCSHRGVSLYYGYVEAGGIRCAYHGWLYDASGRCLEQPFETKQSTTKDAFRHPAYPVQELGGLLFAYLGPSPVPLLPRWDVLARGDGKRTLEIHPVINCNWLQCQENSLDPTHNYFLHARRMVERGIRRSDSLRAPQAYTFQEYEWGIIKRNIYGGDGMDPWEELGHPAVFPNMLRHVVEGRAQGKDVPPIEILGSLPIDMQYRVPLDDTHTQIIVVDFFPTEDGRPVDGDPDEVPVTYLNIKDDAGEYLLDTFASQDEMAWETQGPITNRTTERLGVTDTGIVTWRRVLQDQIRLVQDGGEPMGVVRDPVANEVIELGPSRMWDGNKFVPKPWAGWRNGKKMWESPPVPLRH